MLCIHTTRNICDYRAGWSGGPQSFPDDDLWKTLNDKFLDIAVLESCKLFGEPKGEHHWAKVVADPEAFEADLLDRLPLSPTDWNECIRSQRSYRDEFLAHLDNLAVMQIPELSAALEAVATIHSTLCSNDDRGCVAADVLMPCRFEAW